MYSFYGQVDRAYYAGFQIPEELFQRIKTHLVRETARIGVKLTQRDFVMGLIEQALAEAEASLAPQEAPESTEEAPDNTEPRVPPQTPARPARRRRETRRTSNNNTRSQSKGPENTSQADVSSGPFFVFSRRR